MSESGSGIRVEQPIGNRLDVETSPLIPLQRGTTGGAHGGEVSVSPKLLLEKPACSGNDNVLYSGLLCGYILLETLVALAVLSIGVVAVNRSLHQALLTQAMARDYTEARFLLEQVMAQAELQPLLVPGVTEGGFGEAHARYRWRRSVEIIELPPPAMPPLDHVPRRVRLEDIEQEPLRLGRVRVTVGWTRRGQPFERTVETLAPITKVYVEEQVAEYE
jgi:hypothetical protein